MIDGWMAEAGSRSERESERARGEGEGKGALRWALASASARILRTFGIASYRGNAIVCAHGPAAAGLR